MVPHKKFPRDCSLCHLPKRWDALRPDFKFDHKKETGFALEGAHASASCLRCHNDRGPVTVFKARGCAGCHVDPHKAAMGMDCRRCHGQDDWQLRGAQGERIADHARTRFPLDGMHATLRCDQCHARASSGDFRGAPLDCFQCHRAAYASAPKHAASNFPRDCRVCHKTVAFAGAVFNHVAFGAGANCVSCHLAEYQRAPNHVTGGFSQTCSQCHNTSAWAGARFTHSAGATNCVSCHLTNYQSAPNHVAQSFPQTCAQCHNTSSWLGAIFTHTSGATNCASCHHAKFVAATSPVNHVAQGIIESACNQCHSNSSPVWQPASFVHTPSDCYNSATYHAHRWSGRPASCAQCHPSSYTTATCTACHSSSFNTRPNCPN